MSKKSENANMKQCFVSALCPLVLDTPEAELLRSVKFAMDYGKTTVEYEGKAPSNGGVLPRVVRDV